MATDGKSFFRAKGFIPFTSASFSGPRNTFPLARCLHERRELYLKQEEGNMIKNFMFALAMGTLLFPITTFASPTIKNFKVSDFTAPGWEILATRIKNGATPFYKQLNTLASSEKIKDPTDKDGRLKSDVQHHILSIINPLLDPSKKLWNDPQFGPVVKNPPLNSLAKMMLEDISDSPTPQDVTDLNRALLEEKLSPLMAKQEEELICTSYQKDSPREGENIGDGFLFGQGNHSVGGIASYSLFRYNIADKDASFNEKAAGLGLAFRIYTDNQLRQAGAIHISQVPEACRAKPSDGLTYHIAKKGRFAKIAPIISISPTIFVSQDKDDNEVTMQPSLTFGFLNDFFSIGIGYNLSGPDSGEWFLIAGPSVGFSF